MKINLLCSWVSVCFVLQILLRQIQSAAVSPTWGSTPYLQSDIVEIRVSSQTYSTTSTTVAATFVNAFSTVPSLTYGLRKYQGKFIFSIGNDSLLN